LTVSNSSGTFALQQRCRPAAECVTTYGRSSGLSNGMNMGLSDSSLLSGGNVVINSPSAAIGSSGSNGMTHTVVVALIAGVLRFVLFAVEAAVSDTVEYVWGADLHTVTKGSARHPPQTASRPSGARHTCLRTSHL
jgi:plastocyanin